MPIAYRVHEKSKKLSSSTSFTHMHTSIACALKNYESREITFLVSVVIEIPWNMNEPTCVTDEIHLVFRLLNLGSKEDNRHPIRG